MGSNGCCRVAEGLPCPACDQLGQAEFEVAQAELALENAKQKRWLASQRANECHDPFSTRLPVEISSRILLMCLIPLPTIKNFKGPRVWVPKGKEVDRSFSPQLVLGAVCRRWRRIIWSTPQFWNMIHLYLSTYSPSYYATVFKEWIERSGELPLFIYVNFVDPSLGVDPLPKEELPVLLSIVATLNTCVRRWFLVQLSLPAAYMTLLRWSGSEATNVKGLSLKSYAYPTFPPFTGNAVFYVEPYAMLERLSISGFRLHFVDGHWTKLTVFTGAKLLLTECIEVLRFASQIRTCTFESIREEEDDPHTVTPPTAPTVHTALRNFTLVNADSVIFTYMTCPNLLDLILNNPCSSQFKEDLINFVRRSGCSLQTISAILENPYHDDFVDLLKITPTVKTLEITHFDDVFFKTLAETTDDEPNHGFLPNLRHLIFFGIRSFRWSAIPPLLPMHPPQEGWHRRPLRKIELQVENDPGDLLPGREEYLGVYDTDFIDKTSLNAILDNIANGFDIQITEPGGEDLIDASMEYWGLGVDDWEEYFCV